MNDLILILGGLGAFVLALLAAFLGGGKSAKTKAKLDTAKKEVQAHETRNEIEADIANGPAGGAADRLREWQRK